MRLGRCHHCGAGRAPGCAPQRVGPEVHVEEPDRSRKCSALPATAVATARGRADVAERGREPRAGRRARVLFARGGPAVAARPAAPLGVVQPCRAARAPRGDAPSINDATAIPVVETDRSGRERSIPVTRGCCDLSRLLAGPLDDLMSSGWIVFGTGTLGTRPRRPRRSGLSLANPSLMGALAGRSPDALARRWWRYSRGGVTSLLGRPTVKYT